ncbi:MAG: Gfo/Idh/MocA family oxidoreductase [Candidatus Anammoximicrobium sp.]|nr:Gfo/Idh/MocA family oxidoreductase [Candidatus Anammoximicrobium sp.]
MNPSRRSFLAHSSVLPFVGLLGPGYKSPQDFYEQMEATIAQHKDRKQVFNMCGYAAPAIPDLRVGYIGLGNRGYASIQRLGRMEGVEIRAICDVYDFPIQRAKDFLRLHRRPEPAVYTGSRDAWKALCEREDLDLIYVLTPTFYHAEMAVHVMASGKHAAVEVSAAQRVDDCWRLVDTSERTRKHCVILENCVYDFFESMAINMAHQGFFGDIVHAEGAYLHPERPLFDEPKPPLSKESAPWYGSVLALAPGNRIPTHGTAPICQAMKIGRGDRLDYLTSMETDDFIRAKTANALAASGSAYHQQFKNQRHAGNVNTTMIRTVSGKTLLVEFDAVNPRPYSRIFQLAGSRGFAQKYPLPPRIYPDGEHLADAAEMKTLERQYTPELIRSIEDTAKRFGGHGGMDFTVDWRLVDNLRNGRPLDVDVYDAALWSSITPLTLWSVMNRSAPIDVPDFTCGAWRTNPPLRLTLDGGGNTVVRDVPG